MVEKHIVGQAKKTREIKYVNQFHEKNLFLAKFYFLQFQKWPKIIFGARKNFKYAKNAISRKFFIFIYLISRIFLPGLFF